MSRGNGKSCSWAFSIVQCENRGERKGCVRYALMMLLLLSERRAFAIFQKLVASFLRVGAEASACVRVA